MYSIIDIAIFLFSLINYTTFSSIFNLLPVIFGNLRMSRYIIIKSAERMKQTENSATANQHAACIYFPSKLLSHWP
jgi:hypothetical protein